ncbi:hypothetical protein ACFWGC_20185 [Cytobacillus pseudoceanisediminis]|uniref:hypothetical protein n=1 Tax=Cytobacillus pseudoceanisediminis TaxID=3051614 RepID=UPI00364E99CD
MNKDDIIKILVKDDASLDPEKIKIIEKLKEQSQNNLVSTLNSLYSQEEFRDTGGENALTGFYFQFLTSLYYLSEVLEGNWDFIALELHQDIIVGNAEIIRFIQVKSKVLQERKYIEKVSDTKLYLDWLQKLLPMARFFPKSTNKTTQFELVTNYMISNSPTVNMEHYLYNDKFQLEITEDDDILKKLKENPSKLGDSIFDYYNDCEENEIDLLSRFSIRPLTIHPDIKDFVHTVSSKLGALVTSSARLTFEDINFLIAELFYRCTHNSDKDTLIIDRNAAEQYLSVLKKRVSSNLAPFYNTTNSNMVIEKVIATINNDFSLMKLEDHIKGQLTDELEKLRNQLKSWINDEKHALELLHRYVDAKEYSLNVTQLDEIGVTTRYLELFKTIFVVGIIFNNEIILSSKFKSLLIKEINQLFISTLGLDIGQTKEAGIEKLFTIIEKSTLEQKLNMIIKTHYTIFQGDYDEEFLQGEFLQLGKFFGEEVDGLESQEGVLTVDNNWIILPGLRLISGIKKARSFSDFVEFKDGLVQLWGQIQPK